VPCQWHPLTAMENAAKDGFHYEGRAMVMPVKCTGLVKVSYLLKLFAKGVRGVLVLGCREDDCRYYNGSKRCAEIVEETREILDLAGIPPERLQFHVVGESQGAEFKRVLKGFLKQFGKAVKARGGDAAPKRTGDPRKAKRAGRAGRATRARRVRQGTGPRKAKRGKTRGTTRRHR
jgi:coenzyme F420-reducing hydrogenase delta subunit